MRASILFAISIGLGALLALLSSVTPIPQTADSAPSENGCSLPGVATWGMAFMTPRGDDGVSVPETEPVVRVQCFHHRDEPGTSRLGVVGANLRRASMRKIDLTSAKIDGANLEGVDLAGAILNQTQGLDTPPPKVSVPAAAHPPAPAQTGAPAAASAARAPGSPTGSPAPNPTTRRAFG